MKKSFFLFILLTNSFLFGTAQLDTFSRYPNEYFVETGSSLGYGIDCALNWGFKHIYSIELDPSCYDYCRDRYANNETVKLFFGDSGLRLYEMIKDINVPITFWLDGHAGSLSLIGPLMNPILQELEQIKMHPIKTHTILIDDIRLFGEVEFNFIPLSEVVKKVLEINPNYKITYVLGHAAGDILVAQVD